jgi:two-component system chemotaxis response regulator CheV
MPRMDGLHLTSRVKGNATTKGVPVVLFSSLVSDDNRKKGEQVGADVQIPKPELAEMVRLVDRIVSGQSTNTRSVVREAA